MVLAPEQKALAAEWRERNPQTPDEIAAFYSTSAAVADDLASWHARDETRQRWTQRIVELAKEQGAKTVLDVGAGDGTDLAALLDSGARTMSAIEPNDGLRDAAFRRLRLDAPPGSAWVFAQPSLDAWENTVRDCPEMDNPDLTLLMDVLEHVPNAPAFLDRVIEHIPVGGWLVEATPTWDIANPTHLKENWGWSPVGQLRKNGFQITEADHHFHIWKRVSTGVETSQTAILVSYRAVAPETVTAISRMHHLGNWNVLPHTNDALVTRGRSMAVSAWWRELPDDVFLMIDSDIVFEPRDAMKLVERCRTQYPVISAAYAIRDGKQIASRIRPGETVEFHADAEPVAVDYAATGFLAVRRDVIDTLIKRLPLCHAGQPWSFWPFFDHRIVELPNGDHEYISEDWDFSLKCREAGIPVYLDPSIRLKHLGMYAYELEDITLPKGKPHYPHIAIKESERRYE